MSRPVSASDLRAWFRPRSSRERIGAEFEILLVDLFARRETPFSGPRGVEEVLKRLVHSGRGWRPIEEEGHLIALARDDGGAVTLEPGSQLELSTPPRESAVEIERDYRAFVAELNGILPGMGLKALGIGANPFSGSREVVLGPKRRYAIMTEYLARTGDLAIDMMRRTLSVHCTFDYVDEPDAMEKLRVAFLASPIVTALFAHSPLDRLAPNGFASVRAEIWRRTDPDRCGFLPAALEPGYGFDRYVEDLLDTPLIFTYRDGRYRPAHGLPARAWFDGRTERLADHAGITPAADDLEWVINQTFRDARLRRYLECRAADFPPPAMAIAPVALWTGLLYDAEARRTVIERLGGLPAEALRRLGGAVARDGLRAREGDEEVRSIAQALVSAARAALRRRGRGEERLLDPLDPILADGRSPADLLLERWNGELGRDPDKLIAALAL